MRKVVFAPIDVDIVTVVGLLEVVVVLDSGLFAFVM